LTLPAEYGGVATASTGNHGQGIALGARIAGKRAVVAVPAGANPVKVAAIEALGADLRVAGPDLVSANDAAKQYAADEGLLYVEDGEDPALMAGCATLAVEIFEQLPGFDDLVIPAGGGNLLGAMALVIDHLAPEVRLTAVQSTGAPAVQASWAAGTATWSDRCDTFAGGLATNYPGHFTFPYWATRTDHVRLVSDDDLVDAAVTMLAATGHLPEGAGAAALAGVLADPERYRGRTVVILLSGSNAERVILDRLLLRS
jgi:threonine dehydratase